jgi:hypothetical protein
MDNHHDVSKHLGQRSGGVRPLSGDATAPARRKFDIPQDHPHNAVPARSSDASAWVGPPEVPGRPTRKRVAPDNSNRRAPFCTVDCVASDEGNSHVAEPVPSRL